MVYEETPSNTKMPSVLYSVNFGICECKKAIRCDLETAIIIESVRRGWMLPHLLTLINSSAYIFQPRYIELNG